MNAYRLRFISVPRGPFGREVSFCILIEAESEADAQLIGTRMRAEETWSFSRVEPVAE